MSDEVKAKMWLDQLAASRADAAERVRIQASIAELSLKAMMLAHGGAMIGLFTFLGNLLDKGNGSIAFRADRIWLAFAFFIVGFVVTLLAHVFAFLSQDRFFNQAMREVFRLEKTVTQGKAETDQTDEIRIFKQGQRFYLGGMALAVASVLLFGAGALTALAGVLA